MSRPNTKQPTTTTSTTGPLPLPLPSSSVGTTAPDRYRALLASHRQLEARLREEQRLSSWWQERVGALDRRCRDVNTELRAALDQKRALMRTVRFLKAEVGHLWRCRLVEADKCKDTSAELDAFLVAAEREMGVAKASWALEGWRGAEDHHQQQQQEEGGEARATAGGDPAIKALVQTLWSVQGEDSIVSEKSSVCECDASRTLRALFPRSDERARALEEEQPDPLTEMLLRRRRSKGSRVVATTTATEEEEEEEEEGEKQEVRVTTPVTTDPAPAEVRTPANMQKTAAAAVAAAAARGRQVAGASPATTASPGTTGTGTTGTGTGTTSSITASPPVTESPITPFVGEVQTPEALSRARKEHKQALRMKLKATREKVEGIRRENGVLEGLLIADRTDGARGS